MIIDIFFMRITLSSIFAGCYFYVRRIAHLRSYSINAKSIWRMALLDFITRIFILSSILFSQIIYIYLHSINNLILN